MVRAILEGRKTMTRRVVKPQPGEGETIGTCNYTGSGFAIWRDRSCTCREVKCPYGNAYPEEVPSRLWVKETHYPIGETGQVFYRADNSNNFGDHLKWTGKWKPSIYMRRKYARILLEVTGVRVEMLQDITEEDAKAEGLYRISKDGGTTYKYGIPDRDGWPGTDDDGWPWHEWSRFARPAFCTLWDSINGKHYPWESSPWVWVISFRRTNPAS
jgi:hypothetical protein